jgi:hypothetical protein
LDLYFESLSDLSLIFLSAPGQVTLAFHEGEPPRELGRLRAGDAVGEMVLLLGHPFSATVQPDLKRYT